MSGEAVTVTQALKHVEQALERAQKHGSTEGLWLFARHWQVVHDALRSQSPAQTAGDELVERTTARLIELVEWLQEHEDNIYLLPPADVARLRDLLSATRIQSDAATIAGQAERIAALEGENAMLKERGAQAVIAYHVAICSPKGVVPVDNFYDAEMAARIEQDLARARAALATSKGGK